MTICHQFMWFESPSRNNMFKSSFYREVLTLNPANFLKARQEWIDVSSVTHPTIRVYKNGFYKPVQLPYALRSFPDGRRGQRQMWPDNSKGFLYYHAPPNRPRIAGEVRLRLTPANDPSTFEQGSDLCFIDTTNPNDDSTLSQPWRRPLYSLATNLATRPLYEKLIEDGFIPPDLDKAIQSLPKLRFMYSRCQFVHSINDTFILDLSSDWITIASISESGILPIQLLRQFRDFRINQNPYTGSVLARFERSTLPQHINTRTVVLRVLQEVTPVECVLPDYDEYIVRPRPQQLFAKRFHGKLRPWSVNIDRPGVGKRTVMGLKLIWKSTSGLERQKSL